MIATADAQGGVTMRNRMISGGLALALTAIFCAWVSSASAQDWKAEWDRVVAAAKKEGKLVICISPSTTRRDFLHKRWKEDFPEIELSISITRGTAFVPQVVTERAAGTYLWDVFDSGPNTGADSVRAGILDTLIPELILPEVKDPAIWGGWESAFFDRERKYVLALLSDVQSPTTTPSASRRRRRSGSGSRSCSSPSSRTKSTGTTRAYWALAHPTWR